jgi:hypothetical protein
MSISSVIPTELYEEFVNAMCGKLIGEGQDRKVFELPITNNKWCVKFETGSGRLFQNVEEWNVWQAVRDTEHAKWFAPCHWISPNGRVLIMRQTEQLRKSEYPDKVPNYFTDMKFGNFGHLEGNFVAHDYGVHLISQKGLTNRMITAHWWE